MKRLLGIACMVSVFALIIATEAAALSLSVNVMRTSGYFADNGGEFTLTPSSDLGSMVLGYYSDNARVGRGFESFCLELHENVSTWTNYNVVINNEAVGGGRNLNPPAGDNGGDVISVGTAWLYGQFVRGTLAGYDYNPGVSTRALSALALQQAIWWLEDEIVDGYQYPNSVVFSVDDNVFVQAAISRFTTAEGAKANNASRGFGVAVLNLTSATGARAQDQLVYVPEPMTLILLGLGLVGLAGVRRKFKA